MVVCYARSAHFTLLLGRLLLRLAKLAIWHFLAVIVFTARPRTGYTYMSGGRTYHEHKSTKTTYTTPSTIIQRGEQPHLSELYTFVSVPRSSFSRFKSAKCRRTWSLSSSACNSGRIWMRDHTFSRASSLFEVKQKAWLTRPDTQQQLQTDKVRRARGWLRALRMRSNSEVT